MIGELVYFHLRRWFFKSVSTSTVSLNGNGAPRASPWYLYIFGGIRRSIPSHAQGFVWLPFSYSSTVKSSAKADKYLSLTGWSPKIIKGGSNKGDKSKGLTDPLRLKRFKDLYACLESISIDYDIMERSRSTLMVPATFQWSDLGSWSALDEMVEKDRAGNILKGNTIDIESQNSIIFSGERLIATIGPKNMVVVDTPDATLVTPKERVQEVRKIVEKLKQTNREEHFLHKTV